MAINVLKVSIPIDKGNMEIDMSTLNLKNTVEQTQTTYSVSRKLIRTFPNRLKPTMGLYLSYINRWDIF